MIGRIQRDYARSVVHPDSDMILEITRLLVEEARKAKGHDVSVTWAKTRMAAEQEAREEKPIDLVVTALEIPADDKPSAGAGEQRRQGLELVRRLRAVSPGMSAILITSQVDNDVFAFAQSARVGLVMEGRDFWDQLIAKVNEYLRLHLSPRSQVVSTWRLPCRPRRGATTSSKSRGNLLAEPNVLSGRSFQVETFGQSISRSSIWRSQAPGITRQTPTMGGAAELAE